MKTRRIYLIFWCAAVGVLAFVLLDFWSHRNVPLPQKFEAYWRYDIEQMEASGKLPKAWYDVREVEIIGGTPETKKWLRRIEAPVKVKRTDGHHKLEVLVVIWTEEGRKGALTQYNLVDLNTRNMIWELGRTLIYGEPTEREPWQDLLERILPSDLPPGKPTTPASPAKNPESK